MHMMKPIQNLYNVFFKFDLMIKYNTKHLRLSKVVDFDSHISNTISDEGL